MPVLRAGLGMVEGIWEMMPGAEVWHIGLFRDERTLRPVQYYNKLPVAPTVQVCLILDPMLATGGSAVATVDILKHWGAQRIKYVGIIGAPEGVERLHAAHPDVPDPPGRRGRAAQRDRLHRPWPGRRGRPAVWDGVKESILEVRLPVWYPTLHHPTEIVARDRTD